MDSPDKYKSSVAFIDLLFNILIGFVFLFIIAFLLINPIAKKGDVVVPAEILITLTWPDDSVDDIDLWVRSPDGQTVGFLKKDAGVMFLDRDDRGVIEETMKVGEEVVTLQLNREVVTIRGRMPGTYNISAHFYKKVTYIEPNFKSYKELPITVEVQKINPYSIIYKQTNIVKSENQISNFYQFTVNDDGYISNVVKSDEDVVPTRIMSGSIDDTMLAPYLPK